MSPETLLLVSVALCAAGGAARRLAPALHVLGCAGGIAATVMALRAPSPALLAPLSVAWPLPGAAFAIGIDGLSAIFLLPLFLVSAAVAFDAARDAASRALPLFHGIATTGMALVFVARNGVLFLVAWEAMALAGYFLVVAGGKEKSVREAGWIYLAATHTGTLLLFVLFSLLSRHTGSFTIATLPPGLAGGAAGVAVFWLAIAGFGLKAGLMPFHVWLPGAHASAPSPVSALLSGVLIKTGVYGIVRVLSLFPDPPTWWGGTLLSLGALSGVLGVAFALGQHDLKRLLAYHSVENVGIIVMGIGLGFLGLARGVEAWTVLGFGGGLLHVVNHALFKSLLFLGAGSVVHATGTREMDRLGGLARKLPRTATLFLLGSVAICGLPPLNGLVSEWLLYLGLFGGPREAVGVPFAVPALALIGGLALTCFAKAFGVVFLGEPRGDARKEAHETSVLPMAFLGLLCAAVGLAPPIVAPLLDRALSVLAPGASPVAALAPLRTLAAVHLSVLLLLASVAAVLLAAMRRFPARSGPTWDCGYAAPTPRMQYTSSSFARFTVSWFAWALRPHAAEPPADGLFPRAKRFESHVPESVLELLVLPGLARGERLLAWVRRLQQGRIQLYLVYVAATLLLLLLFV